MLDPRRPALNRAELEFSSLAAASITGVASVAEGIRRTGLGTAVRNGQREEPHLLAMSTTRIADCDILQPTLARCRRHAKPLRGSRAELAAESELRCHTPTPDRSQVGQCQIGALLDGDQLRTAATVMMCAALLRREQGVRLVVPDAQEQGVDDRLARFGTTAFNSRSLALPVSKMSATRQAD